MAQRHIPQTILAYLTDRATQGLGPTDAADITNHVGASRPTINRHLTKLTDSGEILREGRGPATTYRRAVPLAHIEPVAATALAEHNPQATNKPSWSAGSRSLRALLEAPIGTRTSSSYHRSFVDNYLPNQSSLLPLQLAQSLFADGRSQGRQPAGTYARKVLEQLLIDLSWQSSRLEGNRMSLLDTRELFMKGRSAGEDRDSIMLLNHKDAIEFMVDAVPEYGLTVSVVRNVQSILMQGLLENPQSVGAIRKTIVNIAGSVYVPSQVPQLLEEMLEHIVDKARSVNNPLEAAFFLWVNIAYLQPFEDGNKRTSRLCANLPLMLANSAPLSFLDVEPADYAMAMLGVYERRDVTIAAELFEWTYRRSIAKYKVILEAMSAPNPFRAKYREHLSEAVKEVVVLRRTMVSAIASLVLPEVDQLPFMGLLREELQGLEVYNCARYRLPIGKTQEWIQAGRPM
jgi:Fic family protein